MLDASRSSARVNNPNLFFSLLTFPDDSPALTVEEDQSAHVFPKEGRQKKVLEIFNDFFSSFSPFLGDRGIDRSERQKVSTKNCHFWNAWGKKDEHYVCSTRKWMGQKAQRQFDANWDRFAPEMQETLSEIMFIFWPTFLFIWFQHFQRPKMKRL